MTTGLCIALIKALGGGGGQKGGGVLMVNMNSETLALDKTYAEIVSATDNSIVLFKLPNEDVEGSFFIASLQAYGPYENDPSKLILLFSFYDGMITFLADSEDSYPVID